MTLVEVAGNDQHVTAPCHFALIHHGETEMRERVFEFLLPALQDPKQAIYICGPPGDAERLLAYVEMKVGRDLRPEIRQRRIILGHGDPDADQQLQNLLDPIRELSERRLSPIRVIGPAAWDVPGYAAPEDFLWYESRIRPAIEGLPTVIMCTYDASQLPEEALQYGAYETHSHTLINGVVAESPSFLEADRYLKTRLVHLPWLAPADRPEVSPASEAHPKRGRRSRKQ
jgi:MEDS: MEthanogen/methylotroph, DcmR Sensory domain